MKHSYELLSRHVRIRIGILVFLTLLPLAVHAQSVVINEIFTANDSVYAPDTDNPDYTPDYVELQNLTGSDIDLGVGPWKLVSVNDAETNYVFKAGQTIPANGFLLVYLDTKTNVPAAIHAGFSLRASRGDTLALFNGSAMVASNRFGIQANNFSIGRVPDGSGAFQLNLPTPGSNNLAAPLGDVLKLRLNEWQALGSGSGRGTNDWIEIYNPETNAVALGGVVLSDSPLGAPPADALRDLSFIAPQGFVQIFLVENANDADEVEHFSLSSRNGDHIYMFAPGASTSFDDVPTSKVGTNELIHANETEGRVPDGGDLIISFKKPTPGDSNFGPIPEIVVSELLTHTDRPLEDAIELLNVTNVAVNLSDWWISDEKNNPKKFRIPANTTLAPGGRVVFYEWVGVPGAPGFNTGGTGHSPDFTLNSAHGGSVYLFKGDANGNLSGFRRGTDFESSQNGVSFGRYTTSEGKSDFVAMSDLSLGTSVRAGQNPALITTFRTGAGAPNPYPLVGPVVINEIHYRPPDDVVLGISTNDNSRVEFIELRNITTQPVLLYDPIIYRDDDGLILPRGSIYADGRTNTWRIRGGVDFDLPMNVTLPPDGYALVVNFDPTTNQTRLAEFRATFPNLPDNVPLFGPYKGKLSNGGATVELRKPDPPQGPLHPEDFQFVPYILVDRVKYDDTAPWPTGPDGTGQSLQRIVSTDYGNDPINWKGAMPTPGLPNSETPVAPPTITMQPASQTVSAGSTATFSVTANGSLLGYRWLFNDAPMLSATNPTLTLPNVTGADAGTYRVRVSNPAGEMLSAPATLTVQAGAVDTIRPTVTITAPLANAKLSEPVAILRGTASDRGGVTNVEYQLNSDPFVSATGTSSWQAQLSLVPGTNIVRVRAADAAGNVSLLITRRFFYAKTAPFIVGVLGNGTVTGATNGQPLEIGRAYMVTAVPSNGWLFAEWMGDATGTSAKLTFTMQEFFGVVARFVPNPFIPTKGTYHGLFHELAGVQHASSGFFTLTLTDRGSYTATLLNAGKRYTTRGNFDLSGQATNSIPRTGSSPLTIAWSLAVDGSDQITGSVTDGNWSADLLGDRAVWNSRSNAAPFAPKYTIVIPGITNPPESMASSPEGNGYGTATTDASGVLNFRGFLADGTPVFQRVALSKNGEWPLYISLYGGLGSLLGWVTFADEPGSDLSSLPVSWTKPPLPTAKYYPQGFHVESPMTGSRYVPPSGASNTVLNIAHGSISFVGGNLPEPLVNSFVLEPGSKLTNEGPNKLTLTFALPTGLFTGSLTPTNTTRAIPFKGTVLQKANNASGYFLRTTSSGRVLLEATP
jgi:hypothetical protein